jgi:uncharacterized protein
MSKRLDSLLVKPAGPDCNMACTYCFYLEKEALFKESKIHRMSEEILEEMIRQALTQGGSHFSFGWQGGEPTLMGLSFFEQAVALQQQYGRGQSVGNGLQTNGLLIDDDWSRFLGKYNFLVGLSLDGPEHIHDRYRMDRGGKGTWTRVMDSAKRMLDGGVSVNALIVLNDYSVRFPEEIYWFHKELGLTYMQFIPVMECLDAPKEHAPFSLPAEAFGRFLCKVFDLWHADLDGLTPGTSIRFFDSLFFRYVGMTPPECTLLEECGVYLVVEHNGDVYSCDFYVDPEWRLGNIMHDRLFDLLNTERQRTFGQKKADLPESCPECEWLSFCCGGCPRDRFADRDGRSKNHLCEGFKIFFSHAHERLLKLAEAWKNREAMEAREKQHARAVPQGNVNTKPGRNDPCPCGSGKKFKRCCGP